MATVPPPINSINVNLPAVRESADYIRSSHNSLVTEHDNLKSFLQNLRGDWHSNAGMSWETAQNNWDLSADAVYEVLWELYVVLANIHDNYIATDTALSRQWSG